MHYGDAVSFRCTARGGSTIIDMPFIKFSVYFRFRVVFIDVLLL